MKNILENLFEKNRDVVLFAYLFGSYGENTQSARSDLDVAVFLKGHDERLNFDKKTDLYLQLSKTLKRDDIDLVIMNHFKNLVILNNIITRGMVVFCQDEPFRLEYEQKILHQAIDFKTQRIMAMGI